VSTAESHAASDVGVVPVDLADVCYEVGGGAALTQAARPTPVPSEVSATADLRHLTKGRRNGVRLGDASASSRADTVFPALTFTPLRS